jgi:GNAT superfamily N-acetyltransferase
LTKGSITAVRGGGTIAWQADAEQDWGGKDMFGASASLEKSARRTDRFTIRAVEERNLPALAVMVAAFAAQHGDTATATPEALGREVLAESSKSWLAAVVAERFDAMPVGYAVAYRAYEPNSAEAFALLSQLFVVAGERRHGVGAALLRAVQQLAAEWGCSELRLHVPMDNVNARHFCRSQGGMERSQGRMVHVIVRLAQLLGSHRHFQIECQLPSERGDGFLPAVVDRR